MSLDGDRAARRRVATRLAEVRNQDGLTPVCSWCRKARTESGHWVEVTPGLLERPGTSLTHGVCPDCARQLLEARHDAA